MYNLEGDTSWQNIEQSLLVQLLFHDFPGARVGATCKFMKILLALQASFPGKDGDAFADEKEKSYKYEGQGTNQGTKRKI